MPAKKPTPEELPSDELVLAALDRAECHHGRNEPGEALRTIATHLGLPFHSGTSLRLRPKVEALHTAGLVEPLRRRSLDVWAITNSGHLWLQAARTAGDMESRPESPQHRKWREAHAAAGERIAGFRGELRGTLDEAIALLETDDEAPSATWFALSVRLHDASWRLAAVIHCLREWQEPEDSERDTDDPPFNQRGRRFPGRWDKGLNRERPTARASCPTHPLAVHPTDDSNGSSSTSCWSIPDCGESGS